MCGFVVLDAGKPTGAMTSSGGFRDVHGFLGLRSMCDIDLCSILIGLRALCVHITPKGLVINMAMK